MQDNFDINLFDSTLLNLLQLLLKSGNGFFKAIRKLRSI